MDDRLVAAKTQSSMEAEEAPQVSNFGYVFSEFWTTRRVRKPYPQAVPSIARRFGSVFLGPGAIRGLLACPQ